MQYFSKIYNNYDYEIKGKLLVNKQNKDKRVDEVSRSWDDWKFSKVKKNSLKLSVAKHFAKWMYIFENTTTKLLTEEKKKYSVT